MRKYWDEFWARYNAGSWEPDTKQLLGEILEPGDLFVDVGAWIGPVTFWALELGARVIAIEPDPVAAAELRRAGDFDGRLTLHECAVTPDPGTVRLSPRRGPLGNSMALITDAGHGVDVRGRDFFDIVGAETPKLVTVDIEGYEAKLLPNLAPQLAQCGATLQVELHPHVNPAPILPEWFAGFSHVDWPQEPKGRLVARP